MHANTWTDDSKRLVLQRALGKEMIRRMISISILVVGLLMAGLSQASTGIVETQDLFISDDAGKLSNDRLKSLAEQAQAMLDRILAFWSADSRIK